MLKANPKGADGITMNCSRRSFLKGVTAAAGSGAAGLPLRTFAADCGKSTLQATKEAGILKAGVTMEVPYFGFIDEKGNHVGFEYDLVTEIAKRLNVKLQVTQVTSATRIPILQQGRIDLVASTMTHYRSRDDVIDFSIDYFYSPQTLLVRKNSGIRKVADLNGNGGGPYGLGVRENDSKWRDAINYALQDIWNDKTWDKLFDKWVGPNTKLQLTKEVLGFEMETWH